MSTSWLREISTNTNGNGTGLSFALGCLKYWFQYILGFTDFIEHGVNVVHWEGLIVWHGTNGELNLSGSDFEFRDLVYSSGIGGAVGRWLVIKDTVTSNCGIYKIISHPPVPGNTVIIDFRSGGTEYPVQSTGIEWWAIGEDPVSAIITYEALRGDGWAEGTWVIRNDGTSINNTIRWISRLNSNPGYTPPPRYGRIVCGNRFTRPNSLVGKTLNGSIAGTPFSIVFTGTNPLSITNVVSQASIARPVTSDPGGYSTSGGEYLTFGDDVTNLTLVYSGSTAWIELGLTGTSNLVVPTVTTTIYNIEDRTDPIGPPILTPTPAATIAAAIASWWGAGGVPSGAQVTLTAVYTGSRGNDFCDKQGVGLFIPPGTPGVYPELSTRQGNFFRCKTPHSSGWAIRVEIWDQYTGNPYLRITVSTNGAWDETCKEIGPVYLGSYSSKTNWLYAVTDMAGEFAYFMLHQSTDNRHNGCFVTPITPYDVGHINSELVVLHGCTTNAVASWDGTTALRNYDDTKWGHGLVAVVTRILSAYMVDSTYSGQANSFVNWSSRTNNSRTGKNDVLNGSPILADPDNLSDAFQILGRLKGHYIARSNLTARTPFDDEGTKDKIHWYGGVVFDWPSGITPQH